MKRAEDSRFAPGEWEFVSGTIENNEKAEDCILREVKEETGLSGKLMNSKSAFEIIDNDGRWIVIPFYVSVENAEILISTEHSAFAWMDTHEIESIPYMHDMKKLWSE